MSKAKFTITYYYVKYKSGDIDKRHTRTANVYADNLSDAIKKVQALDCDFIAIADSGVHINELAEGSK